MIRDSDVVQVDVKSDFNWELSMQENPESATGAKTIKCHELSLKKKQLVVRVAELGFHPQFVEDAISHKKLDFNQDKELLYSSVFQICEEKSQKQRKSVNQIESNRVEEEQVFLEKFMAPYHFFWINHIYNGLEQEEKTNTKLTHDQDKVQIKVIQNVPGKVEGQQEDQLEKVEVKSQIQIEVKDKEENNGGGKKKHVIQPKGPKLSYLGNQKYNAESLLHDEFLGFNDQMEGQIQQIRVPQFSKKISKVHSGRKSNPDSIEEKEVELESQVKEYCSICFDDIPQSEMQSVSPCQHRFCCTCIISYMEDCIKRANVQRVNCPFEGCTEEYTEEIIKQKVSYELMQRLRKFKNRQLISKDPNVRWCPKLDCGNYAKKTHFSTKLKCICGQEICFTCGNPYHQDLSCEQALDVFYKDAIQQFKIHPCPKCRSPIQKKSGCNHMTCYSCSHEFCWVCFGQYNRTHYAIWNLCGCIIPGGQFVETTPWSYPNLWKVLMVLPKIIGLLLIICAWLILLPFVLDSQDAMEREIQEGTIDSLYIKYKRMRKCQRIMVYVSFFFIGIILFPLSALIEVVPLSCIMVADLIKERC